MWQQWIETYGYWVLFLGAALEGETILVIAGYSVSRGYLDPLPAVLLAVAGATGSDSLYYWIGRRAGYRVLRRFPALRSIRGRAALILRRRGAATAFFTRFAYGLRFAIPMMMGASRVSPRTFHTYNLLGALAFVGVYLGIGILFGEAMQQLLGRVRPYETQIIIGLVSAGLIFWTIREYRIYRGLPPEGERVLAEVERSDTQPRDDP